MAKIAIILALCICHVFKHDKIKGGVKVLDIPITKTMHVFQYFRVRLVFLKIYY